MKTIFDCETEVGSCDRRALGSARPLESDSCFVCAHTRAYLNGSQGMLKIEHRCYLRCGDEVHDQPWVRPELMIEPLAQSERETTQLAKQLHEQFISRVLERVRDQCLV